MTKAEQLKDAQLDLDFGKVDEILKTYEYKKQNLIAVLQSVQSVFRYLPEDVLTYVGVKMDISPASVYGVATFYSQFSLDPKGKYEIKVCDGTACHVRGSMPVLNAIMQKLQVSKENPTTEDLMFSVETVSCLGACGLAPVVVINDKVYPQMTPEAMKIVLDTLIKEEKEA